MEAELDGHGIDHRRRLGERHVRRAEGFGVAPKSDQAGRPDVVADVELPVGLDEVVLEVLGRRVGIITEPAVGNEPYRMIEPLRP